MSKSLNRMEKEKPQYWICDECANKRGWTAANHGVTKVYDFCGYCDEQIKQFITPTIDFKKPLLGK